MRPELILLLSAAVLSLSSCAQDKQQSPASEREAPEHEPFQLQKIKMPAGFKVSTYAEVPGARQLCLTPAGVLFVGTKGKQGQVFAVLDKDKDGRADEVIEVAKGLFMPNGVAFRKGSLYVAEVNRVLRYDNIENALHSPPKPVTVIDTLPREAHHGWKYIRFGPDDLLYIPVGAPCNLCERSYPFASLLRMKPDGTGLELYAKGIRNTVGFDWDKQQHLWFTDNGRDWLADDLPPDELNYAPQAGMNFGYPYRYGNNVADPEFGNKHTTDVFTPPAMCLGPHVASLGMRFYTGSMFPRQYQNQVFIAEHGSWNRSSKIGYRISLVRLIDGKAHSYETFADGWMQDQHVFGRPVDLLVMPDGALLVSDDLRGAIYRITYSKEERAE